MTQDAKGGFGDFGLLERWATLLAHAEATLVAEAGEGCLRLEKISVGKKTLRRSLQEQHDRAMKVFREHATQLAYALLQSAKGGKKGAAWTVGMNAAKDLIDRSTPLEAIERLRELYALAHVATIKPLGRLPTHPPWEED